jgi:glycosyltransferase involved in cell wall biosynthesis
VVWGGHPGEWEGEHPVTVARDIGSDGVFFAGWRGHEDLARALAASDALVMPSLNDSNPQAPLEAMAIGLPVIAVHVAFHRAFIARRARELEPGGHFEVLAVDAAPRSPNAAKSSPSTICGHTSAR